MAHLPDDQAFAIRIGNSMEESPQVKIRRSAVLTPKAIHTNLVLIKRLESRGHTLRGGGRTNYWKVLA